jgi:hypothetical protein
MVDGKFVLRDRKAVTIDERKLLKKVEESAADLMSKAR